MSSETPQNPAIGGKIPQLNSIVDETGEQRFLGRTTPNEFEMASMKAAGYATTLPESMWKEFDFRDRNPPMAKRIKDQDGRGACNGFALASQLEWHLWLKHGIDIALSGWFPYAIMCRGIDRGSSIIEALRIAMEYGVAPEEYVKYGIINPNQLTQEAYAAGKRFRIGEGTPLKNFAQQMTATQLERPFNLSLDAREDFGSLDRNGCVPARAGKGNHAILGGLGAKKLPDGTWAILFQNSWTPRWGDGGYAWYREVNIKGQRSMESYEASVVLDDPKNPIGPLPPS